MKWIVTLVGISLPLAALAGDTVDPGVHAESAAVTVPAADEPADSLVLGGLDSGRVLSDEELGGQRARENVELVEITINNQDQEGTVTDNVATGNVNGDNLINGAAFSNASGLLSTVQNSGNNVLIQNSTIINVSVGTGPD